MKALIPLCIAVFAVNLVKVEASDKKTLEKMTEYELFEKRAREHFNLNGPSSEEVLNSDTERELFDEKAREHFNHKRPSREEGLDSDTERELFEKRAREHFNHKRPSREEALKLAGRVKEGVHSLNRKPHRRERRDIGSDIMDNPEDLRGTLRTRRSARSSKLNQIADRVKKNVEQIRNNHPLSEKHDEIRSRRKRSAKQEMDEIAARIKAAIAKAKGE